VSARFRFQRHPPMSLRCAMRSAISARQSTSRAGERQGGCSWKRTTHVVAMCAMRSAISAAEHIESRRTTGRCAMRSAISARRAHRGRLWTRPYDARGTRLTHCPSRRLPDPPLPARPQYGFSDVTGQGCKNRISPLSSDIGSVPRRSQGTRIHTWTLETGRKN